jgi:hypothetical protein
MKSICAAAILLIMATPVFSAQDAYAEDTLVVSGKAVVFFGPSKSEYLAMTHEQKDAIDEELYEFYHSRGKVQALLASNAIQEFSTARDRIQVRLEDSQNHTFLRRDFDSVVGLILTDGRQEPVVLLGAASVPDLITQFEEYFGLY